jgi:hypothetical protein
MKVASNVRSNKKSGAIKQGKWIDDATAKKVAVGTYTGPKSDKIVGEGKSAKVLSANNRTVAVKKRKS